MKGGGKGQRGGGRKGAKARRELENLVSTDGTVPCESESGRSGNFDGDLGVI